MTSEWVTRETLLHKIRRQHDEAAWEDFVHYYSQYIYNIIRRMNVNHHDAEEIHQIVNTKIWKKMPEFEYDANRGRFRGWVCTVTGNEVKMFMRKKLRMDPDLGEEAREDVSKCLHGVEQCHVEELAEQEWAEHITSLAWKEITPSFDEKTLKAFELMSKGGDVGEVSEKLGVSESSVYVYKKRVQDKLLAEIKRLNSELD